MKRGEILFLSTEGKIMANRKRARKPVVLSKFKVGDKVRVKHGVRDTDYPDMPLGGWAGTITEVQEDGMYTVRWSKETLANIHPVVKKRSEKDGTVLEEYWLRDYDLEPDPGGPLDIEQPKAITTKPLSSKDQDDRIRMIFGLTSNDPLPNVGEDTLLRYYEYLSKNMRFPLRVTRFVETGPFEGRKETVTVLSLLDPASEPPDETEGLICQARLAGDRIEMPLAEFEVDGDAPGLQLLADYCYWFWNSAAEPDDHEAENEPQNPLATPMDRSSDDVNGPLSTLGAAVKCSLLGAFSGIVVGSAIGAIPGAERGVYIGGTTLGVLGAILGGRFGFFFGAINRIRFGRIFGIVFGVVNGALLGAYLGVLLTAWIGAIPGLLLGAMIAIFRPRRRVDILSPFFGAIAGSGIGTGILALCRNHDGAVEGMIYGGTIGAVVGVVLFLAVVVSLNVMPNERNG